ncbi:G-protein coupled receptor 20 [Alosa alosa]|uniref:G-protein coupled receptor 20 n=1 Tax=Alosa alosa TaxID=278164 RepID=UPI00201517CF|nr:G-protein coupled receptor 20 [Alosa alosa]
MGNIVASTLNINLNATDLNATQHESLEASYIRKISHLDEDLYQDFYSLWITLMVVNTLMFVVGAVLNSLALYVFCVRTRATTAPVIYTINLAVADLLVALSLPARIALYYSGGQCQACVHVHTFSYFVNMYCSILFLTSICVDRYLAVVWAAGGASSLRWRSPGVARWVSAGVWIFAVVTTYSLQTTAAMDFSGSGSSCCRLPLLFALTVLEFVLPLLAIVGFTARVACALADRRLMPQSRGRRRRAVRLLVAVLLVFAVCFTPFHVRQVVVYFDLGDSRVQHVVAYHATVTLSSLNSCLDPVVYCFVPDGVRSALSRPYRLALGGRGGVDGDADSVQRNSRATGRSAAALVHSVATLTLNPSSLSSAELPV